MRYPSVIWWWPSKHRDPWIVTVWIGDGWRFTWYWPTLRLAWRDWQARSRRPLGVTYTRSGPITDPEDEPRG